MSFNLFELHKKEEDLFPESWIGFKGRNINKIINRVVTEIITNKKNYSYYKISQEISHKENICVNAVFRYLKKSNFIPIPIILSLLDIWKKTLNKNLNEINNLRELILKNVEFLRVNNSSSREIIAIDDLNEDLCYIAGAHAADGMVSLHLTFSSKNKEELIEFLDNLSKKIPNLNFTKLYLDRPKKYFNIGLTLNTSLNKNISSILFEDDLIKSREIRLKKEYRWKLEEEYESALISLCDKISTCFGLEFVIKKSIHNSWVIQSKNKLLVRYLVELFNFPYGKKSRIVDEPRVIKNSQLPLRKSFFMGVMTFDGCVTKNATITLQSYSLNLIRSFNNVLGLSKIKSITGKTNRGSYFIESSDNKNELKKWIDFVDLDTIKGKKLNGFLNGFKQKVNSEEEAIKNLSSIFDLSNTKLTIKDNFHIIKSLSIFTITDYCNFVDRGYNKLITKSLARANIKLFERCYILKRQNKAKYFIRSNSTKGATLVNYYSFNPNFEDWRVI